MKHQKGNRMDLNKIVVDVKQTIGEKTLLVDQRPSFVYKDGQKGPQDGIKVTCLSEAAGFEKVDIKLLGIMELPFAYDGTPVQVEFEGLEGKLWQDWANRDAIRLSATAKGIKPANGKKLQLNS